MTAKTIAEVIREVLRKGSYQMPGDTLPYETQANAVAAALSAAGFGLVSDAKREALEEAADYFESNVGVSEFSDLSVRDDCRWGHIEEAWEYQGPYMDWLRNRAKAVRGEG